MVMNYQNDWLIFDIHYSYSFSLSYAFSRNIVFLLQLFLKNGFFLEENTIFIRLVLVFNYYLKQIFREIIKKLM